MKTEFCSTQNFEILIIHQPSLGPREVPHKIWARSVQPFRCLLDSNKQTDRQAKHIYRLNLIFFQALVPSNHMNHVQVSIFNIISLI